MDVIIGIKFENFVIIAADMTISQYIVVVKTDENKIHKLSDKLVMAISGARGDAIQFSEYISKSTHLYKIRNGYNLSPGACASFTRETLAEALRTMNSYRLNLLLAGYDDQEGPKLYLMDFLGTMAEMRHAAHGFGGFISLSIMDRYYSSLMSPEGAYDLLKKCIHEIQERLVINLPNFKVQLIDKNGIQDLPTITAEDLATEYNSVFIN